MKRLLSFLIATISTFGVLTLNSGTTSVVNAEDESVTKLVSPDKVCGTETVFESSGLLRYPWEYLTNVYPDTKTEANPNGVPTSEIADLEIKFFDGESFDENKEYPTIIESNHHDVIGSSTIITELKKFYRENEVTVHVALRYLAKDKNEYSDSDYYLPMENNEKYISHTYTFNYADCLEYDFYLSGTPAGDSSIKFTLDEKSEIFSLKEQRFEKTGNVTIYCSKKDSLEPSEAEQHIECKTINIDKVGDYTFQFSFKYFAGAQEFKTQDQPDLSQLNGYYKYDYQKPTLDPTKYNAYIFGPATGFDNIWGLYEEGKMTLNKETRIYSIEFEMMGSSYYKLILNDTNDVRHEFQSKEIPTTNAGLYRIQFSFEEHDGFEAIKNNDSLYDGFYKSDFIQPLDITDSTGTNVLSGKEVHTKKEWMPTEKNTYTNDNENDGYQLPAVDDKRDEHVFYLFDLGEKKLIDSFKVFWEASCPDGYNIFVSVKEIEDLDNFEYLDEPGEEWIQIPETTRVKKDDKNYIDSVKCLVNAKYILLQTTKHSTNSSSYGYYLREIEAFSPKDSQFIYGAQVGTSDNGKAIRFIGVVAVPDTENFNDKICFELSYKDAEESIKGPKEVEITRFFKTLTTQLNDVNNQSLTAPDGYYFFSLTLTGIKEGEYTLSLKVNEATTQTVSYVYEENSLSKKVSE